MHTKSNYICHFCTYCFYCNTVLVIILIRLLKYINVKMAIIIIFDCLLIYTYIHSGHFLFKIILNTKNKMYNNTLQKLELYTKIRIVYISFIENV